MVPRCLRRNNTGIFWFGDQNPRHWDANSDKQECRGFICKEESNLCDLFEDKDS